MIHRLRKETQFNESKIKQILPNHIYKQFYVFEFKKIDRIFSTHKSNCKSKFQRLIEIGNPLSKPVDSDHHSHLTDSWFINLSDTQFPPVVAKTLGLGKNFGTPFSSNKIPTKHLIADFESNIHKIQEDDRNAARLKYQNINIYIYIYS